MKGHWKRNRSVIAESQALVGGGGRVGDGGKGLFCYLSIEEH